jgi:plasmid replication initiation protein
MQKSEKKTDKIKQQKNYELSEIRSYKVVKANDLVQKARFQLTMQEQKIVLYLISKIKPEDKDFMHQNFRITEFCKVCGIDYDNGKNYKNVKDTIKTLSDKSVWLMNDAGTEMLVRWISKAWINKKSGAVKLRLDDDMKPYLLHLQERFTSYELLYTLAMRSQYSIRLYEILKSYEYQYRKIFEVEELKRILFAENYTRYPDFKRKVIEIAVLEINDLSDIFITYEPIKKGRKFNKIEFFIRLKRDINERLLTWEKIENTINPKQINLVDLETGVKL